MITRLKNRARRLKNQKEYKEQQEVIEKCRKYLLENPLNADSHFQYALAEYEQGNVFLGLAELKTAEILGYDSKAIKPHVEKCISKLPDLRDLNHNQYFRFKSLRDELVKRIKEKGRADFENISVLDVGGGGGTFSAFIPEFKYCLVEPMKNGITGENLPFSDNSFDYVVSCHVLEHVPTEEREEFLNSLLAKCKTGIILLNPIFVPETLPQERLELYIELTDEDWAKEHYDCKLPTIDSIKDFAQRNNLHFSYTGNGQVTTTIAYAYLEFFMRGDAEKKAKFEKINQFFNSYDFDLMNSQNMPTAGLFYLERQTK